MFKLFQTLKVGTVTLKQRKAMAPMTRNRADAPETLLATEGTIISPHRGDYPNIFGIYNDGQIAAWKEIAIVGSRPCGHPQYMKASGFDVVSSSDIAMTSPFSGETHHPRPLTEKEIWETVAEFTAAAENAIAAGFDGVEVHGPFGYLVDRFIQDVSNKRTDEWGGSIENCVRFSLKIVKAITGSIGSEKTAFRISPWNRYQGMGMEDPRPQFTYLVQRLAKFNLAYLHIFESDAKERGEDIKFLIGAYGAASPVVVVNNYDVEKAYRAVDEEYADHDNIVVAFGRPFISNPDIVAKAKHCKPLVPSDSKTYYAQCDEGYIDYPSTEKLRDLLSIFVYNDAELQTDRQRTLLARSPDYVFA